VGRVLLTPIRRRAGVPIGRLQDGGFTKRARGYSSVQAGGPDRELLHKA
jgi:hypothetical protein